MHCIWPKTDGFLSYRIKHLCAELKIIYSLIFFCKWQERLIFLLFPQLHPQVQFNYKNNNKIFFSLLHYLVLHSVSTSRLQTTHFSQILIDMYLYKTQMFDSLDFHQHQLNSISHIITLFASAALLYPHPPPPPPSSCPSL